MKLKKSLITKMVALTLLTSFGVMGCITTTGQQKTGSVELRQKKQKIDMDVSQTLDRLYKQAPGSRELVLKAQGVLVFPSVIAAGFVVGGQYGEGALQIGNKISGYYKTVSASIGLQAGAQSKAVVFLFMTQDALNRFRSSEGWSAGADASVAVLNVGANGVVDTDSVKAPVEAFVLTNAGLMANLNLEGTKVSPLFK